MAAYGDDDDSLREYIQSLSTSTISVGLVEVSRTPGARSVVTRNTFTELGPLVEQLSKQVLRPKVSVDVSSLRALLTTSLQPAARRSETPSLVSNYYEYVDDLPAHSQPYYAGASEPCRDHSCGSLGTNIECIMSFGHVDSRPVTESGLPGHCFTAVNTRHVFHI